MKITDVRLKRSSGNKVKAVGSITIDNDFVVHDVRVVNGVNGLFVALPSRKLADGAFRDLVHPITAEARELLQKLVMERFALLSEQEAAVPAPVAAGGSDTAAAPVAEPVTAAASSPTGVSGALATNTLVTVEPSAAAVPVEVGTGEASVAPSEVPAAFDRALD